MPSRRRSGSSPLSLRGGASLQLAGRIPQQRADLRQAGLVVGAHHVGHPGHLGVDAEPAQLFHGHLFPQHLLDHRRPGDEHLAGAAHHEDEVRERRRVGRHADARPHDRRDLRDGARRDAVLEEDLPDGGGDAQPLLDARPHRVVEPDARHPQGAGRADAVGDLLGVGAAHRPGQHRAILGEQVHRPPVDPREAAHHPVRGPAPLRHAEVRALGLGQHELFREAARVHQPLDALPGRELALAVLLVDGAGVACEDARLQVGEALFGGRNSSRGAIGFRCFAFFGHEGRVSRRWSRCGSARRRCRRTKEREQVSTECPGRPT